jgi:hypothetical protein
MRVRHMYHKLKLAPSPDCPCEQDQQTAEHVLQDCTLFTQAFGPRLLVISNPGVEDFSHRL